MNEEVSQTPDRTPMKLAALAAMGIVLVGSLTSNLIGLNSKPAYNKGEIIITNEVDSATNNFGTTNRLYECDYECP
jgi:hypothetical protein